MIVPIVKAASEFVEVTVFAEAVFPIAVLLKMRLGGESAAGATPFPVKLIICSPGATLSLIVIAPSMVPRVSGVDVTLMVQVAPGARLAVQVVVSANSPLATMLLFVNVVVVLVFFSVTALAALVVPTPCEENARLPGAYDTVCAELLDARANTNTKKEPTITRLRVMDISRLLQTSAHPGVRLRFSDGRQKKSSCRTKHHSMRKPEADRASRTDTDGNYLTPNRGSRCRNLHTGSAQPDF